MIEARDFCTCGDTKCPYHPTNHDKGCDLCIQKNIKLGEIPSCFFNEVGTASGLPAYHYIDFAKMVMEKENKK